jgi:S-DNA-T family DNA segregation ATPase FtsK/SpoIIIE
MNYKKPIKTHIFNVQDLKIGEITTEQDTLNLQTLDRIFINKDIACECNRVIRTASCSIYDFELFNYNITFEKVKKLEKTLQMFLRKDSIVIDPSKTCAGFTITIPHDERIIIPLGNCMDMTKNNSNTFSIPLGLDAENKSVLFDITKAPHVLICGATGSGKSVCVNAIISSILSNCDPSEVQFVLIDPKQVEFSRYNKMKFFLTCDVVDNMYKASTALYTICHNMEKRYRTISAMGCKDIDEFNAISPQKYSRAIVVIDELAELMMRNKKEVEPLLIRLAQMGRACGIHLILATQRPSREVVTGLLKVNIPTKICFKVPSAVNSRVVLDISGAEKLTGDGDGLLLNPDGKDPIRFQGSFVSTSEIDNLVNYINTQKI